MSFYASYPGSGGAGGVPIYPNFASLPVAPPDGTVAITSNDDTLYAYNQGTLTWIIIGGAGSILTVGTIDSTTASTNGAAIVANQLVMQSASATRPGLINNATQTVSGVKTFSSAPNLSSLNASLPLQLDGSKNITAAAIDLSGTEATGILASGRFPALTGDVTTSAGSLATTLATVTIAKGGTGQITAAAAFNALNPMTTIGDLIYESGIGVASRLAIGSSANVLTVSGGVPAWAPPATSGTVTSVAMTVPSLLSISGSPITSSGTLALTYSGTALPVANGGTGQVTAAAAFAALSPMTTKGDIIYEDATPTPVRLGVGSSGDVLTVSGGVPTWAAPATSGTVTSVAMTVPSVLSISGSPITSSGTLALSYSGTALPVANGGTGLTSGTSGGVLAYTASGTLASSGALTANQVIIGGGAGVAPSTLAAGSQYQVLVMGASNPGYGQVNLGQSAAITGTLPIANLGGLGVFHTATFTTPSTSSSSTIYSYFLQGGGGGGGGSNGTYGTAGGGGAGGMAIGTFSGVAASTSITITAGAGGTGGANTGGTGGTGGTSSIAATGITTISATGGVGGGGSTASALGAPGGAGAGGSTFTGSPSLSINGSNGQAGYLAVNAAASGLGGVGGAAPYGGTGSPGAPGVGVSNSTGYGAGGAGAAYLSATGGVGAPGLVMIHQITP